MLYICKACGCENNIEDEMELDKPDIRKKIKEYIGELDTEIDRLESELEKQITYCVEACKVTATESRLYGC